MFFQGGKDTKKARSFAKRGGLCFFIGSYRLLSFFDTSNAVACVFHVVVNFE